jgi:YD repeat-containing protein
MRGQPVRISYYRRGEVKPFKEVESEYKTGGTGIQIEGVVVAKNRTFPFELLGGDCIIAGNDKRQFSVTPYTIDETSAPRLSIQKTTEYLPDESKTFVTTEEYEYDNDNGYQLMIKKTVNAPGQVVSRSYRYQYQLPAAVRSVPGNLREEVISMNNQVTAARRIDYDLASPTAVYEWKGAGPDPSFTQFNGTVSDDGYSLHQDVTVSYYLPSQRVKTVLERDGISTSYIWDIAGQLVLGAIRNCANPDRVGYLSFDSPGHRFVSDGVSSSDDGTGLAGSKGYALDNGSITSVAFGPGKYVVEFWHDVQSAGAPLVRWRTGTIMTPVTFNESAEGRWRHIIAVVDASALAANATFVAEISGTGLIDEVRLYPADAQMTTYMHKRFVGLRSMVDPAGVVRQYEYDASGRLQSAKDVDGSILQYFQYNLIHK